MRMKPDSPETLFSVDLYIQRGGHSNRNGTVFLHSFLGNGWTPDCEAEENMLPLNYPVSVNFDS